jgi:hypothetical protein
MAPLLLVLPLLMLEAPLVVSEVPGVVVLPVADEGPPLGLPEVPPAAPPACAYTVPSASAAAQKMLVRNATFAFIFHSFD